MDTVPNPADIDARRQSSAVEFGALDATFQQVARDNRALLRQADYSVGGRTLRTRTVGIELRALFARALLPEAVRRSPALSLDMWDVAEAGVRGPGARGSDEIGERHGAGGERFAVTPDDAYSRYSGPRFLIRHGRLECRAVGWIGDARAVSSWNRTRPWQALVVSWLGAAGSTVVHSALVGRDGHGLLVAGSDGVGKSTMAAACLEAGFEFLGDDVVALDLTPQGTVAGHCVYSVLKFDRRLTTTFPALGASAARYPDPVRDELVVHIPETAPGQARRSTRIVALVFPVLCDRATSRFAPVSPGRALVALTGHQLYAQAGGVADDFTRLATTVERAPAFGFEVGRDALSIVPALEALLARATP